LSIGGEQKEPNMRKKKVVIPYLNVRPNATLREIYAQARKEFTAADLQKYTDLDEPMVPMEQVLAEMEKIQREASRKRRKK
jgi:GTP-binding protein EngB required for normal cell division